MLENQLQKTEKDSKKKDASLKKQLKSLKEENEKQQKIIQQVCTARDRKYWEYYCLNVFEIRLVDINETYLNRTSFGYFFLVLLLYIFSRPSLLRIIVRAPY